MANLDELVAGEVDRQLKRRLSAMQVPILALQGGTPVSGGHRALNFQGSGVQVTDDPGNRRTNIQILGGTIGTTATTLASAASLGKVLDLGVGGTPPTNWFTSGFNDTSWSAPVVQTGATIGSPISGSAWITYSSGLKSANDEWLHRVSFSLPSGTLSTATLQVTVDNQVEELYVNGTSLTVGPTQTQTISIPLADLTSGATNWLAFKLLNLDNPSPTSLSYRLDVASAITIVVPYVLVEDQKSSGTAAGTFTSGAWRTRTLNTLVADTGSIASLASNRVTLPQGTYRCYISAPAAQVDNHQLRLQNITAGTTLLTGTSEYSGDIAGNAQTRSIIAGRFTLGASSALEVQHQCKTTSTHAGTGAMGAAASFGTEIYAVFECWKEA
jgi:hypothetical protein